MRSPSIRRNKLLDHISIHGFSTIQELSQLLNASPMTVRRDIAYLESVGSVRSVHGGVELAIGSPLSRRWTQTVRMNQAQKHAIGIAAAAIIPEDSVIAIDGSSTAYFVARNLANRRLTVITNGVEVLVELGRRPNIALFVTGGELRDVGDLVGPHARLLAESTHVDSYIFGIAGFDLIAGLTEATIYDVEIKRTFMNQARRNILVADSSKANRRFAFTLAPFTAIHTFVTDNGISPQLVSELERQGVQVIVAPVKEDPPATVPEPILLAAQ